MIGNEPGLVGYWRFDEGSGNTVYDQTDNGHNGTIHGNPQWVASDAPVGDHPGMRRSSFTITGHSLVGGLSTRLYYQQEETTSGYDGTRKPMKKNARVMLAAATKKVDGTDPATATLDFLELYYLESGQKDRFLYLRNGEELRYLNASEMITYSSKEQHLYYISRESYSNIEHRHHWKFKPNSDGRTFQLVNRGVSSDRGKRILKN